MKIVLAISLIVVLQTAVAQDNRLLFHYSRYKEAIYTVGDVITVRLKNTNEEIQSQITNITDTTIVFGERTIKPHEVSHIRVDQKTKIWFILRYKYKYIFLMSGVAYFAIDWVNSGEIDRSNLIVSGTMIGAGALCALLISDYIKLKPGRKLVILR